MAIVNMMERFVNDRMEDLLNDYDCCKCDVCKDDIKAVSLNSLPPKYVSTANGELFVRAVTSMNQHSVDIDIAVIKAINNVCKSPRHK